MRSPFRSAIAVVMSLSLFLDSSLALGTPVSYRPSEKHGPIQTQALSARLEEFRLPWDARGSAWMQRLFAVAQPLVRPLTRPSAEKALTLAVPATLLLLAIHAAFHS